MIDFSKFWWLTPIHGTAPESSFHARFAQAKYQLGMTGRLLEKDAEINSARSRLANLALNNGAEVTLWVDCDNVPELTTIVHLLKQAVETGTPQSAVYVRQSNLRDDQEQAKTLCLRPEDVSVWPLGKEGSKLVRSVGLGCLAVPRASYEAIREMCPAVEWGDDPQLDGPHWFLPEMQGTRYVSDDMVFCDRLRRAGVPITAWTNCPVVHWKTMGLMPPSGEHVVHESGEIEQ